MNLDPRIDDLYRLPLNEFTAARNALAKTLGGDEAKRVRALAKPTLVPWALNQLFWKARPTYERLLKSGDALPVGTASASDGSGAEAGTVVGTSIVNTAPPSGALCATAWPPCCSATCRTIASPSPEP